MGQRGKRDKHNKNDWLKIMLRQLKSLQDSDNGFRTLCVTFLGALTTLLFAGVVTYTKVITPSATKGHSFDSPIYFQALASLLTGAVALYTAWQTNRTLNRIKAISIEQLKAAKALNITPQEKEHHPQDSFLLKLILRDPGMLPHLGDIDEDYTNMADNMEPQKAERWRRKQIITAYALVLQEKAARFFNKTLAR